MGTWSRSLGPKVDIQVAAGAEYSELARLDGDLPPREFVRPKGSVTLGWRPDKIWDFSSKLRRRVGQISFYDFLAQPNLRDDRENSGNPDLVPPQSWEAEVEGGKSLGAWGQTRLTLYAHLIEDIVDIIPIGEDEEARRQPAQGDPARRRMAQHVPVRADRPERRQARPRSPASSTPACAIRCRASSARSAAPATAGSRPASATTSPAATGPTASMPSTTTTPATFYLTEINRSWEGPVWLGVYVENKDVAGATVRVGVNNLLDARHRFERTVYDGRRLRDPVLYSQSNDQLIGPIFYLLVKGAF